MWVRWLGGVTEVHGYVGWEGSLKVCSEGSLRYVGTLAGITEVCGYIGWEGSLGYMGMLAGSVCLAALEKPASHFWDQVTCM